MKTKKVAFCFSGQARTFDLCYPYIKKTLLDPVGKNKQDYDIFCCVEDDEDAYKVELLKPTKTVKVKSMSFKEEYKDIFNSNYKKFFARGNINNHLNQINKIHLANNLRKEYEKQQKVSYEWVFRLRFDILPLNEIDYSKLSKQYLYIPPTKLTEAPAYNDMVALGSDKSIDIYSTLIKEFRGTIKTFFSDNFKTSLRLSMFIEKKYLSFFEYLLKGAKKERLLPRFYQMMITARGHFFLRPPQENHYMLEYALFRYLKSKKVDVRIIDMDYVLIRKEWAQSGVLLSRQV